MTTKRIYAQKLVDIRSEEVVVSGDITLEPRNPASPYPLVNGKPFVSGTEFGCINYVAPLLAPVSTFQLAQSVDIVGGGPSVSISGTDIEVKAGLYRFDIQRGDTEGIVNYLLMIKGIDVAAFIREQPTIVKLSLRSKGDISVQEIARNRGGLSPQHAVQWSP